MPRQKLRQNTINLPSLLIDVFILVQTSVINFHLYHIYCDSFGLPNKSIFIDFICPTGLPNRVAQLMISSVD